MVEITPDEMDARFSYHAPRLEQVDRYEVIRASGRAFAESLVELTPDSRERSLALTRV